MAKRVKITTKCVGELALSGEKTCLKVRYAIGVCCWTARQHKEGYARGLEVNRREALGNQGYAMRG